MQNLEKPRPVIFMCTTSIHSSMLEKVHETGKSVQCTISSLENLKKLSETTEIKTKFIGNSIEAYKKLLESYGIKYKLIPERIILDPERGDTLYVLSSKTSTKEGQEEFPDYAVIDVLVYKI